MHFNSNKNEKNIAYIHVSIHAFFRFTLHPHMHTFEQSTQSFMHSHMHTFRGKIPQNFMHSFNYASIYAFTQNIMYLYMHFSKEQNQLPCIQHAFSSRKKIKFHTCIHVY